MRSRPAHISRDTDVDNGQCAPPAERKGPQKRAFEPCQLDKSHSISAVDLVEEVADHFSFAAVASAPAFEATFPNPGEVREGLQPSDLADVSAIEINVDEITASGEPPARISVTIAKAQRRAPSDHSTASSPAVKLAVTGPHREWVDRARLLLSDRIQEGARATPRVQQAVIAAFLLFLGLAIAVEASWHDDAAGLNWAEITAIALGSVSACLLLVIAFWDSITPQLELLPPGGLTRWETLKKRFRFSGRWLADRVATAAVGALIGYFASKIF
jgi:hypothetical protein